MAVTTELPSTVEFDRTLIGHNARWAALARAFERGCVPQTLLISGPSHVGKTTLARRFAQLSLCPQPVRDAADLLAPCGVCRVCHQVEIGTFPDFRVYRPLVNTVDDLGKGIVAPEGLDSSGIFSIQARHFRDEAAYRPTVGPRKVMLMMEADRMREASQDALLKTFEEPVSGLTILLLTETPQRLKQTILSRCAQLPLSLVSDATIAQWLDEQFPGDSLIAEAVRVAAGRPGLAQREMQRLTAQRERGETAVSRLSQSMEFVRRLETAPQFAALALSETALQLAEEWGGEDGATVEDNAERSAEATKKAANAMKRTHIASFLDEISGAYRLRWREDIARGRDARRWSSGLDLIRKTRHYILSNANQQLALDVLFSRLIALHSPNRSS
ncbi:MAG TPA: hypothetical protein VF681_12060 [Abditibacteriaceae bacterium]|jgi:DNA polymerase III delta prime subunit